MINAEDWGRLRRIRRWMFWVVFLPLLLLGIGNLILSTSWGTGLVEKQIEARFNLTCEIASWSWSPWAGGQVDDLEITSSDVEGSSFRVFKIDRIEIDLSWRSLIKGEKRFDRVEVVGVEVDLSLESLKSLMKSREEAIVTAVPDDLKVVDDGSHPNKPLDPADPKTEDSSFEAPAIDQQPNDQRAVTIAPVDDFEGLVVFKDVKARIYSEAVPEFELRFDNFSGEIPLWGQERKGQVHFEGLRIGNDGSEESLSIPIVWKEGVLQMNEPEMHVLGLRFNINAVLRFSSGLPFGVQVKVPEQQIDFTSLRKNAPPVNIACFSSDNLLQGFLLYPSLLSGSSQSQFVSCVIEDPKDGSRITFDRGHSNLIVTEAGVFASDVRLIGDEEAFLGNGFLTASGTGAATLRVIVNPQRAETYEKRVTATDPSWSLGLIPLVTVDRWYRDLRFEVGTQGLTVDLGEGEKEVSFVEVARKFSHAGRAPNPILVP
ncbi:MAG: hypothetical protein QNL80_05375 [Akkermansiaceae bacterium]